MNPQKDFLKKLEDTYCRLKPSPLHGIGVFAIRDIPKGTNVFSGDNGEMIWIDKSEIKNADPEIQKLCEDFCVIKNGKYGCPKNFNSLTIGWCLNESKKNPNMRCDKNYDLYSVRDIKKGEELTVDYSTYNDYPNSD